jgi:hypothetical protein
MDAYRLVRRRASRQRQAALSQFRIFASAEDGSAAEPVSVTVDADGLVTATFGVPVIAVSGSGVSTWTTAERQTWSGYSTSGTFAPTGRKRSFTLNQWRMGYQRLDDRRRFRDLMENVTQAGPVVSASLLNLGVPISVG